MLMADNHRQSDEKPGNLLDRLINGTPILGEIHRLRKDNARLRHLLTSLSRGPEGAYTLRLRDWETALDYVERMTGSMGEDKDILRAKIKRKLDDIVAQTPSQNTIRIYSYDGDLTKQVVRLEPDAQERVLKNIWLFKILDTDAEAMNETYVNIPHRPRGFQAGNYYIEEEIIGPDLLDLSSSSIPSSTTAQDLDGSSEPSRPSCSMTSSSSSATPPCHRSAGNHPWPKRNSRRPWHAMRPFPPIRRRPSQAWVP
ncbi:MAG: hypothetical protein ABIH41_06240 [Nanoarchaeota archaeon]